MEVGNPSIGTVFLEVGGILFMKLRNVPTRLKKTTKPNTIYFHISCFHPTTFAYSKKKTIHYADKNLSRQIIDRQFY